MRLLFIRNTVIPVLIMTKKRILLIGLFGCLLMAGFMHSGCGVYSFKDVSIPDSIKTVRVNFFENRAPYVNPQLSPELTESVKRKIQNQTRLTLSRSDEVHWDISGEIRDYAITTSGISNKQEVTNRLTVSVHISIKKAGAEAAEEFDVSRGFEFNARLSQQAAETQLQTEMIRSLTDDIFNRLFSNW